MAAFDPSDVLRATLSQDRGRLLAALIRELRDFQLAEDSLQDASEAALLHWGRTGPPASAPAWLLRVARRKAIDRIRRNTRFRERIPDLAVLAEADQDAANAEQPDIPDERLSLVFTCCHPALDEKSRVALTLRTLGGLSTEEIAAAFLDKPATMGQRLSRAKSKIAKAGIPFKVPEIEDLPERLSAVLRVIYLIFNEGYRASTGQVVMRTDLSAEAIRLARVVGGLLGDAPEVQGLLALMLLSDARSSARFGPEGAFVPLEHQDRTQWDHRQIREGVSILSALPLTGAYQLQAAISACHCTSPDWEATNWQNISNIYARLDDLEPNPVTRINRAAALIFADETQGAARLLADVKASGEVDEYQPFYLTRAELHQKQGNIEDALADLESAYALTSSQSERAFLRDKMDGL